MDEERGEDKVNKLDFNSIKKKTIHKINYIKSKNHINDKDLYYVVREFFKDFLEINYVFTYQELMEELNKIYLEHDFKKELFSFIEDVGKIEFMEDVYDEKTLEAKLDEFKEIIDELISQRLKEEKHMKSNNKFFSLFKKKEEEDFFEEEIEEIKKCYKIDLEKAKKLYLEIKKEYDELNDVEKKKHYDDLMYVYELINKN